MTQTQKTSTTNGKTQKTKKNKSQAPTQNKPALTGILQRAIESPESVSHGEFLALQSYTGNRALQRMLQRPSNEMNPLGRKSESLSSKSIFQDEATVVQRRPSTILPTQKNAFRLHDVQQPVVQRLVTRAEFERLAGAPSVKAHHSRKGSTYMQILHKLEKAHQYKDSNQEKYKQKLRDIKELVVVWQKSHLVDHLDPHTTAKKSKDLRKHNFLKSLRSEVGYELSNSAPEAKLITDYKKSKYSVRDYLHTWQTVSDQGDALLENTKANLDKYSQNKYIFSVFAYIADRDDREFIQTRLDMTIQKKKDQVYNKRHRKKNHRKIMSGQEIVEATATQIVDTKYTNYSNKQRDDRITELIQHGGESGHAWVNLSIYSPENELIDKQSIGFWPLMQGIVGGLDSAPGVIKSPDTSESFFPRYMTDNLGNKTYKNGLRRFDTEITADGYENAINYAVENMHRPHEYHAKTYNCTTFANEMAQKAGAPLPNQSYLAVPANVIDGAVGGRHYQLFTPDELFHAMGKTADDYQENHLMQHGAYAEKERQWAIMDQLSDLRLTLFKPTGNVGQYLKVAFDGDELLQEVTDTKLPHDVLNVIQTDENGYSEILVQTKQDIYPVMYGVNKDHFDSFMLAVEPLIDEYRLLEQTTSKKMPDYVPTILRPQKNDNQDQQQAPVQTTSLQNQLNNNVAPVQAPPTQIQLSDDVIRQKLTERVNQEIVLTNDLPAYKRYDIEPKPGDLTISQGETIKITKVSDFGSAVNIDYAKNEQIAYGAYLQDVATAIGLT